MRTKKSSSPGLKPAGRDNRSMPGFRIGMLAVSALVLTLAAVGCSGAATRSAGNTRVIGGTAVKAEGPLGTPNYIFPYATALSVPNIADLQYLLYRPLYWFGENGQPTVNNSLSVANPPVFHGAKVTITLKHYMWSNGTPVTAQDVMFWLNMELALPADYGAYSGFPANVHDIKAVTSTELTMTMDEAYSPTWFLYNDLSQVTPMPAVWDRTASGPSSCATTVRDCATVYSYLNGQSQNMSTYATSPIWGIVDGPWKLSTFSSDGHITFVPNKSYSGLVKPTLSRFEEVPFTSDSAEYDVLRAAGAGGQKIDVGYLPTTDAPPRPANAAAGANPLSGYTLTPWYGWSISYYVLNFQSTTGNGPVIRQLYFRQALAYLMNQASVISGPLRGYGAVTVGPVPATPVTSFLSPQGKSGDPYPYNPEKSGSLLASHGWTVVPDGISTCANPGLCGPGIKKGQGLSFTFPYTSGLAYFMSQMEQLKSDAAKIGIRLNLQPEPFNQVASLAGNCVVSKTPCDWDMADWGGLAFGPNYLPTGEATFLCGVPGNAGGYCDKANDAMIGKTLTSNSLSYMYGWENYLSAQLPVEWQPNSPLSLIEVADNLKGVTPLSPTFAINPENWYFVK